ncbi:type III-A CRISPR-associated RAMP protein Csm4 [candidate division WOR-3 bacterium JGI_Cruoil_03_44_89]|uniref:CRISPR system Cms protein Csm4 n=1 Tax=candidate division WOR-3 bacterium JGI_Cruoil_03_44_89 TaxID=1973748 RepID=A0A235BP13_UNCW3|nr:MAG: type III-A CRISPR-associated RAMP protein Csm4 [candidate division WOR-3 bacterium JGI_Cruoil_03_44_89]
MTIFYLKPKGSFIDIIPQSDTLFGAICWGVKILYDEKRLKTMLDKFLKGKPPFLLSSSFPYIENNEKKIHLLPKPISNPLQVSPESLREIERFKEFEKTAFLSQSLFFDIINDELGDLDLYNSFSTQDKSDSEFIKIGSALFKRDEFSLFPWKELDISRNAIDRLSSGTIEGNLFYNKEIFFKKSCGIYFFIKLTEFAESDTLKILKTVMSFYSDRGIGGDVTSGKGQFDLEIKEDETLFEEPENASDFLTLSSYYPKEKEWRHFRKNQTHSWFQVMRKKGKIEASYFPYTNIWKNSLLLIKEGSSFPIMGDNKYYGENPIVIVKEEFDVQQYGFAYIVKRIVGDGD